MAIPLLTTKLYVPPTRAGFQSRPRLVQRLDAGLRMGRRLTLVSAPAGYGKTTLLGEWARKRIDESGTWPSIAWLSLDEGENDPVRFWTYVIAALQRVEGALGQGIPDALRAPQPPPSEALLTLLINQFAALPYGLVLVLDDYHLISNGAIHEALSFLLDHLPENGHLAVATRADPPLPLARLRGRGQLTEVRQADLRFTADEAAAFLGHIVGLDLSAQEVKALEERTEGWITGLQLAALSIQGRDDVSSFVSAFTGSHRFVLDYLTEEVLRRQPELVRGFLLHTSILDRLSGPLCDAVVQRSAPARQGEGSSAIQSAPSNRSAPHSLYRSLADSQAVLEHLEATNLFVVPLDEHRIWYRYHRLFADLLRARLRELHPGRLPELHRRASVWYERAGMLDDAMKHAKAIDDPARVAHIVEAHGRSLLLGGELATLLRWIEGLPESEIRASAPIAVTHAWALLLTGQVRSVEPRLRQVEAMIPKASPLRGDVAAIRAYMASQQGDVPRTIELAEQALDRLPASKLGERAVVHFVLGGASLLVGEVRAAAEAMRRAATVGREGGNLHLTLPALNSLAGIQISRGELRLARETAQEAIYLVTGADGHPLPIAAGALSAQAELSQEWNRLDEALRQAREAVELARFWGNADTLGFGYLTLADVFLVTGNLAEARDTLRDAERLSHDTSLFPSFSLALQAVQARLWLKEGDLAAAKSWADGEPPEAVGLMTMEKHLTLAKVHLALGRRDEALDVATRVVEASRVQGLIAWLVRGLAVQALVYRGLGRSEQALNALAEALTLAQPEGYVRSFVALGPAMAPLLQDAGAQGITPRYVEALLSAFDVLDEGRATRQAQPLIEPLSPRELEVLGLVADGLSNREVGRRLHIAESTVKSHLNSVYGKLAVDNRTQAAARARTLDLL